MNHFYLTRSIKLSEFKGLAEFQRAVKKIPLMPKIPERQTAPPIKIIDTSKKSGDTGDKENGVSHDIEDTVSDVIMKKKKRETMLDKTRGFVKYKRETKMYRDPVQRQEDWEEIFDFKSVRRGLKTQAARCMDCGVPFCHSTSHGCPLGNIIPKFNDLVFHSDWREALNQVKIINC